MLKQIPMEGRGGESLARFRRKRALDNTSETRRLVERAVARAQEGDPEAVRFLYATYADNVYGYVCSIVRDEHEAEDVTQQVFLKLMTTIARYEQRAMPFSAWILRVAHNAAIDGVRARRSVPCEDVRPPDALQHDAGAELARSLRVALDQLPDEQRRVVVMRHMVGLTPREIAGHLGKTENAIHGLHHRGRRTLKHELTHLECAPTTVQQATGHAAAS